MTIEINLLQPVNAEHAILLHDLLINGTKARQKWSKNSVYSVMNQDIKLSNDILLSRNESDDTCYCIVGNTILGEGAFSRVYPIEGILSLSPEGVVLSQNHTLVVKIHHPREVNRKVELIRLKNNWHREYELNKLIPHIGMHRPIYLLTKPSLPTVVNASFIMNRMAGMELYRYMEPSYVKENPVHISSRDRLTISRVLLNVFREQLFQKVVHCDIKPENINIYFDANNDIQLNFIDIDYMSRTYDEPITAPGGTDRYRAPEAGNLNEVVSGEKLDIYSLGATLQIAWGYGDPVCFEKESVDESEARIQAVHNWCFNQYADPVTIEICRRIYDVIRNMTRTDPGIRWSLEQATNEFNYITLLYETSLQPTESPVCAGWFNSINGIHKEMNLRSPVRVGNSGFFGKSDKSNNSNSDSQAENYSYTG